MPVFISGCDENLLKTLIIANIKPSHETRPPVTLSPQHAHKPIVNRIQ